MRRRATDPVASLIARSLRRNIATIEFAKALYLAHAAYRKALVPSFYDLAVADRHQWVALAKATIENINAMKGTPR